MAKEFIFFGGACHKAIKVFACFFYRSTEKWYLELYACLQVRWPCLWWTMDGSWPGTLLRSLSLYLDRWLLSIYTHTPTRYSECKSATTVLVLSSVTLHTYMYWGQNIVFMNIYEAGETNLLQMKSHVTIKYSISLMSYRYILTENRNQRTCFEW